MPDHNALLRAMRARATQWLVPISASVALSTSCFAQLPAWEAHHPQRPGRLIILGSIHLLRASDHPLPAVVDTIYSLADRLVFELDLDDLPGTAIQNSLMGAALLPADASLEDVIEPALFQETADAARTYGVDIRLFSRFEPWFVATMLLSFGLSQLGYEPQYGIEQHLLKMAQDDGKEVLGVEALDAQIAVFDSLSELDQAAFLEQTIAELQRDGDAMTSLVDAWRNGSLEALQSDLMQDFDDFPGLYERLVVDRNTQWAKALEELTSDDVVYGVVVGALHLVGDDSVLEMLRDRGFTVSRLD